MSYYLCKRSSKVLNTIKLMTKNKLNRSLRMAKIGNTRFSPKSPHTTVLYHKELYFVLDGEIQFIMKRQKDVLNFLKNSSRPEEFAIFNLDGGEIWKFDKNKSGLIFTGCLYYKDLFALEDRISKHPFSGKELFDIKAVKARRAKVKRRLRLMFKDPRCGYLSKARESYFECLGDKLCSCAFGSKAESKDALLELEFIMEILDEKSETPLFIDDIIKSIGLINFVKGIYKHKVCTESGLKLYRKDDLQFNGRILREKLLKLPFANHPFIQTKEAWGIA